MATYHTHSVMGNINESILKSKLRPYNGRERNERYIFNFSILESTSRTNLLVLANLTTDFVHDKWPMQGSWQSQQSRPHLLFTGSCPHVTPLLTLYAVDFSRLHARTNVYSIRNRLLDLPAGSTVWCVHQLGVLWPGIGFGDLHSNRSR